MQPRDDPVLLAAALLFTVLSAAAAWFSRGFLEADAVTHYLLSRFAFVDHGYFVGVWARPLVKVLYAAPAAFGGLFAARLVSLTLALLLAWLTYRIARRLGQPRPAYAFVFLLASPLVFLHSTSLLTELPFATLIAAAFLAYLRRWWLAMAVCCALSPLMRPEGFGFILLAAGALVHARRYYWLAVLPLGLVAWSIAGHLVMGEHSWHNWLINSWPYSGQSVYEPGNPLHFLVRMPVLVSPLIFPALVVGSVLYLLQLRGDRAASDRFLAAAIPLAVLVGHSVLYTAGKMASNGELRYMLVVAPFWAVLSSAGFSWFAGQFAWRTPMLLAGAIALLPPLVFNLHYTVVPLPQYEDSKQAQRLMTWYEANYAGTHPRLMAANPSLYYWRDVPFNGPRSLFWKPENIDDPPPGVFAVWDPIFGRFNADASLTADVSRFVDAGWREVAVTAPIASEGQEPIYRVFVSPGKAPPAGG